MARYRALLIVGFASLIGTVPCPAADQPIPVAKLDRTSTVDFEKELLPILNNSCLACHNKTKPKAGLVMETPADILKGGDSGPAVVPGKPAESMLLKSAAHSDKDIEAMPPPGNKVKAPNLTSEQLGLMALWISQGAKGEVKGAGPIAWRQVAPSIQPILAVAVTPDGRLAAAGRGVGIDLYDLKAGKLIGRIADPALKSDATRPAAHRDLVQSLAFTADGKLLASGSYREVKLWKPAKDSEATDWALDKTIGTGDGQSPLADRVLALDFSPDDKTLAIAGGAPTRGGQLSLYSIADGKIEKSLDELHSDTIQAICFSADGKQIVTGSADKFVRLIDLPGGKVARSFEGHTHHVLGVAISKDGKTIVSSGADNAIRFWDVASGDRKKTSPTFDKEATSIHRAGDDFVACTGDARVETFKSDGSKSKTLSGATEFMHAVAASADGKLIVAGGQDGVLRVWTADGKSVGTFQ
ncbi:c-type cytochrome domain-containing protein [Humisphaera borealis]|uniref:NB-ARC domain protein n=1 Tax=Humisphaera borealis TaxID=2807512 RepID=A0A7M2WS77_9BACT|nr:c-type cytochrome domain-containing protein [Humisphaera borealis]QOV88134.1 NB-ARC domain protein [Humisphaera borealis]